MPHASQDPLRGESMRRVTPLNRLAASPWALSCISFVLTAVLIRSNVLTVF
jgi:hypothetical protein